MPRISLAPDLFKVKALLRDPAFYAAVAPIASTLLPGAATWWSHHSVLLAPVLVVLAGHFGVRIGGVISAGRHAASVDPEIARIDSTKAGA